MSKKVKKDKQYLGNFTLPDGETVVGHLKLSGSDTLLTAHPSGSGSAHSEADYIYGTSYIGERITLVDCQFVGGTRTLQNGGRAMHTSDVFPHYVVVGQRHLDPSRPCIESIQFTTNDMPALFHDSDAFGSMRNGTAVMEHLQRAGLMEKVEIGVGPELLYYTGKDTIAEAVTALGKVSFHHQPTIRTRVPGGTTMRNRIVACIEFEAPVGFEEAIDRQCILATFLSLDAGRGQKMKRITLTVAAGDEGAIERLNVIPSMPWKTTPASQSSEPAPFDVPLDPVRRRQEFETVLANWLEKHEGRGLARSRYTDCIQKGHYYDPDRLVAAANLFDLLPEEAVPLSSDVTPEFEKSVAQAKAMFKAHPDGIDRNSVLNNLGRLGKPSLPKKVLHRASIVEARIGARFPELSFVAKTAIKCRNFFVHGGDTGLDLERLNPLMPFLTSALEFIFAASDLIDAGWDCERWIAHGHRNRHAFSSFRSQYRGHLIELRAATETSSEG